MNWKAFFKPNWQKVLIFLFFLTVGGFFGFPISPIMAALYFFHLYASFWELVVLHAMASYLFACLLPYLLAELKERHYFKEFLRPNRFKLLLFFALAALPTLVLLYALDGRVCGGSMMSRGVGPTCSQLDPLELSTWQWLINKGASNYITSVIYLDLEYVFWPTLYLAFFYFLACLLAYQKPKTKKRKK